MHASRVHTTTTGRQTTHKRQNSNTKPPSHHNSGGDHTLFLLAGSHEVLSAGHGQFGQLGAGRRLHVGGPIKVSKYVYVLFLTSLSSCVVLSRLVKVCVCRVCGRRRLTVSPTQEKTYTNNTTQKVLPPHRNAGSVAAIASGRDHSLLLTTGPDAWVAGWGRNRWRQVCRRKRETEGEEHTLVPMLLSLHQQTTSTRSHAHTGALRLPRRRRERRPAAALPPALPWPVGRGRAGGDGRVRLERRRGGGGELMCACSCVGPMRARNYF